MQSGLQQVHPLLQTFVTALAYLGWLEFAPMARFQAATQIRRRIDLSFDLAIGGINLGLEFPQEALTFFFQRNIIGRGRHRFRQARAGGGGDHRHRQHPFLGLTYRAR